MRQLLFCAPVFIALAAAGCIDEEPDNPGPDGGRDAAVEAGAPDAESSPDAQTDASLQGRDAAPEAGLVDADAWVPDGGDEACRLPGAAAADAGVVAEYYRGGCLDEEALIAEICRRAAEAGCVNYTLADCIATNRGVIAFTPEACYPAMIRSAVGCGVYTCDEFGKPGVDITACDAESMAVSVCIFANL